MNRSYPEPGSWWRNVRGGPHERGLVYVVGVEDRRGLIRVKQQHWFNEGTTDAFLGRAGYPELSRFLRNSVRASAPVQASSPDSRALQSAPLEQPK